MSAIDQGLQFLQQLQLTDGSFYSLSSPKIDNFEHSLTYSTTLTTALILINLQHLKDQAVAQSIISKGCKFLSTQASDQWSFNYWNQNSAEYITKPYPDDLDDTFLALSALTLHQPKMFTGKAMAQIVQLLTAAEEQIGGPYYTWLTDDPKWKDTDPTLNSAIGYFLSLHDINLPNLDNYFQQQLKIKTFKSSYYPTNKPFLCLLSRFIKFLTKINDNNWQTPLDAALDCITLLNNDPNNKIIEDGIEFIIKAQFNGGWTAHGYCFDPSINGQIHYSGSAALTTAFCLEALALYNKYPSPQKTMFYLNQEDLLHHQIITAAKNRFNCFDENLQHRFNFWLEKITNFDHSRQITLLSFRFFQSLVSLKPINADFLFKLGLANLLGWIAYTIYDNFLDLEIEPLDLPIANIALRELTNIYSDIDAPFSQIMDQVEQANFWEAANCRNRKELPNWQNNYHRLADRSFGHALSPLTLLISQGYLESSLEFQNVSNFFQHYLIAKQLNDDAHDWEEDLENGHITPIVSLILSQKNQKTTFAQIFWQQTLDQVCKMIFKHCKEAKICLDQTDILLSTEYLKQLITNLEKSAKLALKERDQALQFLNTYQTTQHQ